MTNFAKELQRILNKNNKSAHKFSVECGLAITTIRTIILNDNIPQHLTIHKICENVSPKERTALLAAIKLDRAERKEKEKVIPTPEPEKKSETLGNLASIIKDVLIANEISLKELSEQSGIPLKVLEQMANNKMPTNQEYFIKLGEFIRDSAMQEMQEVVKPEKKLSNIAQFDLGDGKTLTITLQFKIENSGKKGKS